MWAKASGALRSAARTPPTSTPEVQLSWGCSRAVQVPSDGPQGRTGCAFALLCFSGSPMRQTDTGLGWAACLGEHVLQRVTALVEQRLHLPAAPQTKVSNKSLFTPASLLRRCNGQPTRPGHATRGALHMSSYKERHEAHRKVMRLGAPPMGGVWLHTMCAIGSRTFSPCTRGDEG